MTDVFTTARELLSAADEPTRLRGVHLLRDEAVDRVAAAELLVGVLEDPGTYVPHAARAALQDLGGDALGALLAGLRSPESLVRSNCAWALATTHGAAADDVLIALAALVGDEIAMVRQAAAGAIARIDAGAASREALLVELSEDPEPRVRTEAISGLGSIGGLGESGVSALASALEDGRPAVREAAATALGAIEPDDELVARVRRALDEEPTDLVAAPLRALLERWRVDR